MSTHYRIRIETPKALAAEIAEAIDRAIGGPTGQTYLKFPDDPCMAEPETRPIVRTAALVATTTPTVPTLAELLDRLEEKIDDACSTVEEIRDELQDWYDNLPENFQSGDKGQTIEEAIGAIESESLDTLEGIDVGALRTALEPIFDPEARKQESERDARIVFDFSTHGRPFYVRERKQNVDQIRKAFAREGLYGRRLAERFPNGEVAVEISSQTPSFSRSARYADASAQIDEARDLLDRIAARLLDCEASDEARQDADEAIDDLRQELDGLSFDGVEFPGMY